MGTQLWLWCHPISWLVTPFQGILQNPRQHVYWRSNQLPEVLHSYRLCWWCWQYGLDFSPSSLEEMLCMSKKRKIFFLIGHSKILEYAQDFLLAQPVDLTTSQIVTNLKVTTVTKIELFNSLYNDFQVIVIKWFQCKFIMTNISVLCNSFQNGMHLRHSDLDITHF